MSRKFFLIFLGVAGAVSVVFVPLLQTRLEAESNTIYVDDSADNGGDGSEEDPYQDIEEALEEAGNGDKIHVASGTYDESLVVEEEDIEIEGAGKDKTILEGTLLVKKNTKLTKVTVSVEATAAITVEGGVNFTFENAEITGFKKTGIDALAGGGKITVKKSTLHGSPGKGLYIQKGRHIEISDNRIYDNGEEGIDVRNNVDGVIENNIITENGEGGMEIIVGDSGVKIQKNSFTKNKASGIATQFYATAEKDGKILIADNNISSNGKYGIDCNIPSGGNPSDGYWKRSLELQGNEIAKNGREEISGTCKIIEAVEPEEEKDNAIEESAPETLPGEEEPAKEADDLTEEELQKEKLVWEEIDSLTARDGEGEKKAEEALHKIDQRKYFVFLIGPSQANLGVLQEEVRLAKERISRLQTLLGEAKHIQSDQGIQDFIHEEEGNIAKWEAIIREQESKFTLYHWVQGKPLPLPWCFSSVCLGQRAGHF